MNGHSSDAHAPHNDVTLAFDDEQDRVTATTILLLLASDSGEVLQRYLLSLSSSQATGPLAAAQSQRETAIGHGRPSHRPSPLELAAPSHVNPAVKATTKRRSSAAGPSDDAKARVLQHLDAAHQLIATMWHSVSDGPTSVRCCRRRCCCRRSTRVSVLPEVIVFPACFCSLLRSLPSLEC